MGFAPEPVLDAFTPPPTRSAPPRAPAADNNGRTFDDHLDEVNETERPAPAQTEAKDDSAPTTETKPAHADETEASDDETLDPDIALLGGPAPQTTPPPMAAPVFVQIAASQPQQQQSQDADADIAPVSAPEAPAAPSLDADASAAEPVEQSASPGASKSAQAEVKTEAPDAPQAPQQTQNAPPQQTTQTAAAPIEVQQLPPEVQQAIAQTIAPAQHAAERPAQRGAAKEAELTGEAKATPDASNSKTEASADAKVQQQPSKADANGAVTIDTAPAPTQTTSGGADTTSNAQPTALSATTSQASTHVQHAATNAGTERAAPATAQVTREIVRRFNGGSTSFEMRLDPVELGRIEVRMEVTRDHRVTAVITADNPQALTELARHARQLEQQLQSAGLQLSDNGLSFDLRQGGQGSESDDTNTLARGVRGEDTNAEQQQQQPAARPIGYEKWRGVRVDMMV